MIASALACLEQVVAWLWSASWEASVVTLVVISVQGVLREKLNPRWRHTLWMVVLLRLILPIQPECSFSLFQFIPPAAHPVSYRMMEPIFAPSAGGRPIALPDSGMPSTPAPGLSFHYLSLYSLVCLGWLAGAVASLLLTWQVNMRFARQVAHAPEIADPGVLKILDQARSDLGISSKVRLIESSYIESPAIMGLWRPTIMLPATVCAHFDEIELRLIFLHELGHLKRGDLIVQKLMTLLQIVHWFNPVLRYAFWRIRIDREPATDALVLLQAGENEKLRYGLMLVKLLEHFNQRHSPPVLIGVLEDKDQLKHRFSLIARFTRPAYGWSLPGILATGLIGLAGLTKQETLAQTSVPAPVQPAQHLQAPPSYLTDDFKKENPIFFKLDSIIIEQALFNDESLDDVVAFLNQKSKEADPEHIGIKFVIQPGLLKTVKVRVFVTHIPLKDLLNIVCGSSDVHYRIHEDSKTIVIGQLLDTDPLITRTFTVPTWFFSEDEKVDVKHALESKGIEFPPGASAVYLETASKLTVKNTDEQLKYIETFVKIMETGSPTPSPTPTP